MGSLFLCSSLGAWGHLLEDGKLRKKMKTKYQDKSKVKQLPHFKQLQVFYTFISKPDSTP